MSITSSHKSLQRLERQKAFNDAVGVALSGSPKERQTGRSEDSDLRECTPVVPKDPCSYLADTDSASRTAEAEEAPDSVANLGPARLKHPRFSRRVQSKSEPSHTSQDSETADSVIMTPISLVETASQRRVSAPHTQPSRHSQIPKLSTNVATVLKHPTEPRSGTHNEAAHGTESSVFAKSSGNSAKPAIAAKKANTSAGSAVKAGENTPPTSDTQQGPQVLPRAFRGRRGRGWFRGKGRGRGRGVSTS